MKRFIIIVSILESALLCCPAWADIPPPSTIFQVAQE